MWYNAFMNRKKTEKRKSVIQLQKSITQIFVVNKNHLRPYIELFQFSSENIANERLGTFLGFFKINEQSEDSAYVVNFLTSVAKKEYFGSPKRPSVESFEAVLNKLNLAFSELANQGNINWLGKTDAAVCVLEKSNFHFSVSGNAKIFLLRDSMMSEVSEGLSSGETTHPLKTFINVSSGRLEAGDKIIITTDDLFRILSVREIQREAKRFSPEKFIRFLNTALTNELGIAGTFIVDVIESEKPNPMATPEHPPVAEKEPTKTFNAFSGKTFQKPAIQKNEVISKENFEKSSEYVDKKTGHIYIQADSQDGIEKTKLRPAWPAIKKNIAEFCRFAGKNTAKMIQGNSRSSFNLLRSASIQGVAYLKSIKKIKTPRESAESQAPKPPEQQPERKKINNPGDYLSVSFSLWSTFKPFALKIASSASALFSKIGQKTSVAGKENIPAETGILSKTKWLGWITPHLSAIKSRFNSLNRRNKIIAIGFLAAIFILPAIALKKPQTQPPPQTAIPVPEPTAKDRLAGDKNIVFLDNLRTVSSQPDIIDATSLNDSFYAVDSKNIFHFSGSNPEKIAFPEETGVPVAMTAMPDLQLIFIMTDQNKILSFAPATKSFKDNTITVPAGAQIKGMSTYLTYLYLADVAQNSIYRYPRADDGFGQKTDWLKETVDLTGISDMAIDDNVYIAEGNSVFKFFRGKKQDFGLEQSATPIHFDKIATSEDLTDIYTLDTKNSRVIIYDKLGAIVSQYHHPDISEAKKIHPDEKNNLLYIISPQKISSLTISK